MLENRQRDADRWQKLRAGLLRLHRLLPIHLLIELIVVLEVGILKSWVRHVLIDHRLGLEWLDWLDWLDWLESLLGHLRKWVRLGLLALHLVTHHLL